MQSNSSFLLRRVLLIFLSIARFCLSIVMVSLFSLFLWYAFSLMCRVNIPVSVRETAVEECRPPEPSKRWHFSVALSCGRQDCSLVGTDEALELVAFCGNAGNRRQQLSMVCTISRRSINWFSPILSP